MNRPASSSATTSIPLWRQIQKQNFTSIELLADFLQLSELHRKQLLISPSFSLNLPRRLAEKIEKNTLDDPILRQFVPLAEETLAAPGFSTEPVQDSAFRKGKKILHKYEGRALILTTSACAMHCRYCFRQNFPYETETIGFDDEIVYLSKHPSISEVILSGGDPLCLSNRVLSSLFASLDGMSHIQRIRFHSRLPIGIPERIDDSFIELLSSSSKQIVFVIHCNHPKELDSDIITALKKIHFLGIPLLNQSVLLKGINDDPDVLYHLSSTLINSGIIPYYLHQLDPVQGSSHFEVSPPKGPELIRKLQERLSGFGVPRLVREIPGYPSKTFINI